MESPLLARHLKRGKAPRSKWREIANKQQPNVPIELRAAISPCGLVWPHVHDMHIGTKPDVISQVPAVVIGVLEDRDVVGVPKPVAAVADVKVGDCKTKTAEPEQVRASATEAPDMSAAETTGEVSVLPRVIQMIVRIVSARVMPNPLAVIVDVRRVWMPRLVIEMLATLSHRMRSARRSRTVRRNVRRSTANAVSAAMPTMLRER